MRILVALCMLCTVAHAEDQNQDLARAHYATGSSYYEQHRYSEALGEFNEAYRLSQRPGFLYNIGVCYQQLNQPKPAIDAFERYLAATPNGTDRVEVQQRIDHLRAEEAVAPKPAAPPPETKPVYKRGWFWGVMAGVAVVVAGGVATGVVLGTRSSGPRTLSDVTAQ